MVDSISSAEYQYPATTQNLTNAGGYEYQIPSTYNNSIFQGSNLGFNGLGVNGLGLNGLNSIGLGNTGLNGLGVGFDFDNDIMAKNIDWSTIGTTTNQPQQTATQTTDGTIPQTTTPQTTIPADETQEQETSEGGSNIGKVGGTIGVASIPTIMKAYEANKAKAPLKLLTKQHGVSTICMAIAGLGLGWMVDKIIDACKKKTPSTTVAVQN